MGDMRESNQMDQVAHSLPLPLTADFLPRMMPFLHHTVLNHGMSITLNLILNFLVVIYSYLKNM